MVPTTSKFDYGALSDQVANDAKSAAARIRRRLSRTVEDIIEVGQELIAVKSSLEHGQFIPWIEAEFGMTDRTARNFMHVAERFGGKSESLSDFTKEALYLLAAPSTPDEVREEALATAEAGEKVTAATVKELTEKLKAAKEKAKAEKSGAEVARQEAREAVANLREVRQELADLKKKVQVQPPIIEATAVDISEEQPAVVIDPFATAKRALRDIAAGVEDPAQRAMDALVVIEAAQ